jgi:hypothetical protein
VFLRGLILEIVFICIWLHLHLPTDFRFGFVQTSEGVEQHATPTMFVNMITIVHGNEHIFVQGFDAIIGMDVLERGHCTIAGQSMILSF